MTARPVPRRHWRSYGDAPLPTGAEALDEPLSTSTSRDFGFLEHQMIAILKGNLEERRFPSAPQTEPHWPV